MDRETGTVSAVFLNQKGRVPADLNPLLAERMGGARAIEYVKTTGPSTHAEVYAVNQLLNGGAKIDSIVVYTEQIGGSLKATVKPPCVHCDYLLNGVKYVR